jgi:protein-disulfide isomerase
MSGLTPPVGQTDHAQGPADAPATLVEYGDYECPHCGAAYPMIKLLQQSLGDTLRFVYRNFPLSQAHEHAMLAAQAAEAAGVSGDESFWRMHDHLFEHQKALQLTDLVSYAKAIGLDPDQFRRDLEAGTFVARVRSDFRSGVRSGVNGTPTFFINGERYDGDYKQLSLETALRRAAR